MVDYSVLLQSILDRLDLIYTLLLIGFSVIAVVLVLYLLYCAVRIFLEH